jgi:hypothetical protein
MQLPESTKIFALDLRTQTCPLLAPPHEHPRSLGAALAGAVRYRGHQRALQLADRSGSARDRRRPMG